MMGNRFGFCQLHLMDGGVDMNIVRTDEFLYPPSCRIRDYDEIDFERNLDFVIKFIEELRQGALISRL